MEKIDKLQQLMKLIQNDTITPQEVEKFLTMVVDAVKKIKDNFEQISQETLVDVADALKYIESEHVKTIAKTEDIADSITSTFEQRLQEVKELVDNFMKMKPKDGVDADPEYIISEVLNRIELPELPEYPEVELDSGEDIVEKINQLPLTEEYQIDASHIKNLPEATGGRLGSTARNLWQLNDVTITDPTNGQGLSYNSTTKQWENGAGGGASIGGTITGGTAGSVLFVNPDNTIDQDNSNFYYDKTNGWLGLNLAGSAPTNVITARADADPASFESAEMIANAADRDFSSDTGNWTGTNWTIGSGVATHTTGSSAALTLNSAALTTPIVAGKYYKITITATTTTAITNSLVTVRPTLGGLSINNVLSPLGLLVETRTHSVYVQANTTAGLSVTPNTAWAGSIDNVSLVELYSKPAVLSLSNATGTSNTFGVQGLYSGVSSGLIADSIGMGRFAVSKNTSGAGGNIGIGNKSLLATTSARYNIAIGTDALVGNTTGNENIAIGRQALSSNTTGQLNMVMGYGSLCRSHAVSFSTVVGTNILYSLLSGNSNTAIGANSGAALISGANNTFFGADIGAFAGGFSFGSNNLLVGYGNNITGSTVSVPTSNNILVGYSLTLASVSNAMTIGNLLFGTGIDGTGTTISTGSIGIGTNAPDRRFHTEVSDSVTNAVTYATRYSHITSGTAAVGFGTGEEWELENASGTNRVAAATEITWSDATNATEDAKQVTKLIRAGTLTDASTLSSNGELTTVRYLVEANTAGSGSPNIITDVESRTVFTNEGATALNYHTLPTAVAGLTYTFYCDDADGIRVTANTSDIIQINGVASAAAGYAECTAIGGSVTLTAINAVDWVATSVVGTWTLV